MTLQLLADVVAVPNPAIFAALTCAPYPRGISYRLRTKIRWRSDGRAFIFGPHSAPSPGARAATTSALAHSACRACLSDVGGWSFRPPRTRVGHAAPFPSPRPPPTAGSRGGLDTHT